MDHKSNQLDVSRSGFCCATEHWISVPFERLFKSSIVKGPSSNNGEQLKHYSISEQPDGMPYQKAAVEHTIVGNVERHVVTSSNEPPHCSDVGYRTDDVDGCMADLVYKSD